MNLLTRLLTILRPTPSTPEEIAAELEAKRIADQNETVRVSQRAGAAGENYQSGRGTR